MIQGVKNSLLFGFLGALFFIPFLGGVHLFDWDEINFAECSREMMNLDSYLRVHINYQPFWEKPPFFFWLQVISMNLFGVGEFAARFPNAMCGILTLIVLYNIGEKLYNKKFGLVWGLTYFGSVLPFLYFKSGIIDPWFNFFIFLGLYFFILFYWKKEGVQNLTLRKDKIFYLIVSGLLIGFALLTKGPVAYLIVVLCLGIYWILQKFRLYISIPQFLMWTVTALSIMIVWLGIETVLNGTWFITTFTEYQIRLFSTPDAGHGGFFGYHFVVLLLGCFPASIFCIHALLTRSQSLIYQKDFKVWMSILFWVVLILFTIVKSKIVHYSSLAYFPLTFLAALSIYNIIIGKSKFNGWMKAGLIFIGGLYSLATIALPFVGQRIELIKPLFKKDPFALANLNAAVNWTGWESIAGIFLLGILILSIYWINHNRKWLGFRTLFGGTAVFVMLTLIFFIGKIEQYSQGAAIAFFADLKGKDVYVVTKGYKSYAHLYYTDKPPVTNPKSWDINWLLYGDIDKDLYLSTKINKVKDLEGVKGLRKIGEKNGFVFYKRDKVK
ncbi:MAG TPA: glycosyltransferase family 39 protein [Cytophagales bacterium]|nr:glycosyltransferase family 39 protein [Cytophagales bacterium]